MNEFLARFANKPISEKVSTEEPSTSFFSSKPKPVVNPSRKKAFTIRFGLEGDSSSSSSSSSGSSSSSSSSNSDSDSDSDSESGSQKKAKIPKTRKTKAKAAANKAFIVDKTGTEDIDIHEFISAIQRGTGVQIGKPHLAGSFCTLNPKPNTKPSAAAADVRSTLETFQIRKLGFTIELKMADFASVHVDEPSSGTEKPGKKKRGEKEGKEGKDKGAAAVQRRAAPHTADTDVAVSDIVDKLNKMRSAPPMLTASNYYMNNRKYFLTFINEMFQRFAKTASKSKAHVSASAAEVEAQIEAEEFDCSDLSALDKKPFSALYHQRIVREYMNAYSPYRGLLLFHGLGSGKTCSSIVIAEGLSTHKKVIVMTPASLQKNYIEEIKKCGDAMFKLDQHWVFFPLDKVPKGRTASEHEKALLQALARLCDESLHVRHCESLLFQLQSLVLHQRSRHLGAAACQFQQLRVRAAEEGVAVQFPR
jgi:SNF2 family DNA or RNA helicase